MSRGLSSQFGYHAAGANAQPAVATPSATVFSLISSRNTNVSVDLTQKVDASGPNAASLAQNAKAGLAAVKQDVSNLRAGMVADMKQAQAEIVAATRACGYDEQAVFPDTSIAPDSVAELAMGAVNASGKGSFATHLANSLEVTAVVEAIQNDRAKSPDEARAQVADVLRAASDNSQQTLTAQFGHVVQADAAPEMQGSSIDWGEVCDQYPEGLQMIMDFDEASYNPDIFPEFAEVDAALEGIDLKIAELDDVMFKVENNVCAFSVDAMDTESLTAQAANLNAKPDDYDKNAEWDIAGPLAKMLQTPEGLSKVGNSFDREAGLREIVDDHTVRQVVENNMSPMGAMG